MTREWKLVPVDLTEEMHVAAVKAVVRSTGNADCPPNVWAAMLAAAPQPPNETLTLEEARSGQHWHGMDGACAWHLIYRHAEGWGETGTMMQAWFEANQRQPDELAQCKQLLRDIDANMRRAWNDRSLSANAWPTELAQRLAKAVQPTGRCLRVGPCECAPEAQTGCISWIANHEVSGGESRRA